MEPPVAWKTQGAISWRSHNWPDSVSACPPYPGPQHPHLLIEPLGATPGCSLAEAYPDPGLFLSRPNRAVGILPILGVTALTSTTLPWGQ